METTALRRSKITHRAAKSPFNLLVSVISSTDHRRQASRNQASQTMLLGCCSLHAVTPSNLRRQRQLPQVSAVCRSEPGRRAQASSVRVSIGHAKKRRCCCYSTDASQTPESGMFSFCNLDISLVRCPSAPVVPPQHLVTLQTALIGLPNLSDVDTNAQVCLQSAIKLLLKGTQ